MGRASRRKKSKARGGDDSSRTGGILLSDCEDAEINFPHIENADIGIGARGSKRIKINEPLITNDKSQNEPTDGRYRRHKKHIWTVGLAVIAIVIGWILTEVLPHYIASLNKESPLPTPPATPQTSSDADQSQRPQVNVKAANEAKFHNNVVRDTDVTIESENKADVTNNKFENTGAKPQERGDIAIDLDGGKATISNVVIHGVGTPIDGPNMDELTVQYSIIEDEQVRPPQERIQPPNNNN